MQTFNPNTAGLAQRFEIEQETTNFNIIEDLNVMTCNINQY